MNNVVKRLIKVLLFIPMVLVTVLEELYYIGRWVVNGKPLPWFPKLIFKFFEW